jgi:hypothetical protein
MKKIFTPLIALLFFGLCVLPAHAATQSHAKKGTIPMVKLHTNFGDITIQLDAAKAPNTVKNFLEYVKNGSFDNTIFSSRDS